jgi:hypothetical protein
VEFGSGVGEIILYAARKSKHVYSFEATHENFLSLSTNCKNNISNYTLKNNFSIPFDIPDIENISLIKVDIRGDEENILDYLFKIHTSYGVPLLISFYYSVWQNKNIDRFKILNETQKNKIKNFDQTTLIFVNQT